MEKTVSKYRRIDENKPLSIDFSSELGRFVHPATPRKISAQIPQLTLVERTMLAEDTDVISNRSFASHGGAPGRAVHFPTLDFRGPIAKVDKFYAELKKIRSSSRFPAMLKSSLIWVRKAGINLGKTGAQVVKIVDKFFYLPLWVTMPTIFFVSIVLGACLSIFFGF